MILYYIMLYFFSASQYIYIIYIIYILINIYIISIMITQSYATVPYLFIVIILSRTHT